MRWGYEPFNGLRQRITLARRAHIKQRADHAALARFAAGNIEQLRVLALGDQRAEQAAQKLALAVHGLSSVNV